MFSSATLHILKAAHRPDDGGSRPKALRPRPAEVEEVLPPPHEGEAKRLTRAVGTGEGAVGVPRGTDGDYLRLLSARQSVPRSAGIETSQTL